MMNRRQVHQTVTATATTLALGGKHADAASAASASLPADPLPAGAVARLGCNRLWHLWPASNPGLNDLTSSPDGRYLATLGYQDDHIFIWSVPDGEALADKLRRHGLTDVRWHPLTFGIVTLFIGTKLGGEK